MKTTMGDKSRRVSVHPEARDIAGKFGAGDIHAARSGREVMRTLARIVEASAAATSQELWNELEASVDEILDVMPAYAPPLNVMHRVLAEIDRGRTENLRVDETKSAIALLAERYESWSEEARTTIAHLGAAIIPDDGAVFTFTLSETVLRTLRDAWRGGRRFRVLVAESRPNRDGLQTAKILAEEGLSVSVCVDAAIGEAVPCADVVVVGAEAVLADGSASCKVGTYPIALVAHANSIPVYVLADTGKLCASLRLDLPRGVTPIARDDVMGSRKAGGSRVVGHLFDVTPPELITAIVTERGVLSPHEVATIVHELPVSDTLGAKIAALKRHNSD
jgi:translation initiation factor 2B subunit (eIF-2B alpha/beta/delta family)